VRYGCTVIAAYGIVELRRPDGGQERGFRKWSNRSRKQAPPGAVPTHTAHKPRCLARLQDALVLIPASAQSGPQSAWSVTTHATARVTSSDTRTWTKRWDRMKPTAPKQSSICSPQPIVPTRKAGVPDAVKTRWRVGRSRESRLRVPAGPSSLIAELCAAFSCAYPPKAGNGGATAGPTAALAKRLSVGRDEHRCLKQRRHQQAGPAKLPAPSPLP
jgi:hypothetical protein